MLTAAATVGAAELLRAPGARGPAVEAARAHAPDGRIDPDLPIATNRYRDPLPAFALAQAPASPEPPVITLDQPMPLLADPMQTALAALPEPVRQRAAAVLAQRRPALQPPDDPPDPVVLAALDTPATPPASTDRERPAAPSLGERAEQALLSIAPDRHDARRDRWIVYAATSGQAFGLNMVADGQDGLRRAGWSVERLAEWGKGQIGAGWRSGPVQASLAIARREISAFGVNLHDTVAGFSFSFRPHDPPPPSRGS